MPVNRLTIPYEQSDIEILSDCTLCPRECRADRFNGGTGWCRADAGMNIASICIHQGEEPSISGPDGICNIFFSGCNLRCIYCQNHEISRPDAACRGNSICFEDAIKAITNILDRGIRAVGFVSPSHVVPQVKAIIKTLNSIGYKPITVYNTNSYDRKEIIRSLDGMIDVYLPDYKYVTPELSAEFSGALNYPEVAQAAIREMYYQKGSVLQTDNEGRAERGILIRHLVLPGYLAESKKVLSAIAEDISTGISISLMSQYYPTLNVRKHKDLGRTLHRSEYESVVNTMEKLGFRNGWIQDMDSHMNYRPDFSREHPFE
ncbi:MAG: 4Fe-4S cluster-binding domain-containing protein [Bacteroidota bacterium]|nr:4Fe-4S cluster-binding domain-containing protein [Bacteroidota bacterium]